MESNFPQTQSHKDWVRRIGASLPLRLLLLASVSLTAILVIGCISAATGRIVEDFVWMVAAFLCCTITGAAMLLFDWNVRDLPASQGSVPSLLHVAFGFIVRMGIPLLACGFVALQLDEARARSFAVYLLLLYPLVLFTETLLTVWRRQTTELSIAHCGGQKDSGGSNAVGVDN